MSDVANLEIKILSDKVQLAEQRLNKLTAAGKGAESSTNSLTKSFAGLIVPLIGIGAATAGVLKLVSTSRQFEALRAGLETATGSAKGAAEAFEALQEFGAKTPYSLDQSVEAFTKLVNLGLTPSERALMSYGDTASAMGKSLTQMIEAVADASTGEFERLKEFGIKAKTQGDQITFTFRGVATTVKKDAASIEEYLIGLGESNFGGAMEKRMATLDGKLSNLGDAWDRLFDTIGQSSIGDLLKDSVDLATDAITGLTNAMTSTTMNEAIAQLKDLGTTAGASLSKVVALFASLGGGPSYKDRVEGIEATKRAMMEEADIALRGAENEREWAAALKEQTADIKTAEKSYAALVDQRKRGLVDKDTVEAARRSLVNMRTTTKDAMDTAWGIKHAQEQLDGLKASASVAVDSLVAQGASKGKAEQEVKRRIASANAELKMLEAQYDQILNKSTDRLGKFGKGKKSASGPSKEALEKEKQDKAAFKKLNESLKDEELQIADSYFERNRLIMKYTKEGTEERNEMLVASYSVYFDEIKKVQEAKEKEIKAVRESLRTQEEEIQDSYDRRKKIIDDNVADPEDRKKLQDRLAAERDKELKSIADGKQREYEELQASYLREDELLIQAQERRRKLILENTNITETQRAEMLQRLDEKHAMERLEFETRINQERLGNAELLFTNLANAAKGFGGEQSKTYKTLFALSKTFSIAQATLAMSTGIAKALELPWPANIAAGLQVAATGAGILATISGTNFSGAYDKGGMIPAGSVGIVGERGPEFVRGPAVVTGRQDTKAIMDRQSQQAVQPIRVVNVYDSSHVRDYLASSAGERVIMNQVQRNRNTNRRAS